MSTVFLVTGQLIKEWLIVENCCSHIISKTNFDSPAETELITEKETKT